MKKTKLINIAAITIIVVSLIFVVGYFSTVKWSAVTPAESVSATDSNKSPAATEGEVPFFSEIFGTPASNPNAVPPVGVPQITLRLFLAVILSAILAFRPRRNTPFSQRNLSVAQTQILLAVVAAALMMIVGDNMARAFAIFAAATLVRFRTNIRDPKEITVLLISLALGMAAGVGHWKLGIVLCLFILVLLWFLEQQEFEQVFRSMELTIKTRDTDKTQNTLKKIFKRFKLEAEVRELNPADEDNPIGSIAYFLDLRSNLSTDYLSDRIFALDSENIEGITWKHKKEKFIG